jgi:8-oxo-dGTP pyrophosphatase MutT (NUDIX family)
LAFEWAAVRRHFTATAFVVWEARTLLIWHRKLGMWLPPGGHIDPDEDPPQAAIREALEESGLPVRILDDGSYPFSVPRPLPPPVVILEEDIDLPGDFHQHIDHIYFTEALEAPADLRSSPAGPCFWAEAGDLAGPLYLTSPEGSRVEVARDVRVLGAAAIQRWRELGGGRKPHPPAPSP